MGMPACGEVDTYAADVARLRATSPDLAAEIAGFTGVAQVIDWMSARCPAKPVIDLIAMDEFEYDFLVETEPAGRWLAFSVT